MFKGIFKRYCIISRFDLQTILNEVQDINGRVQVLETENEELKKHVNNFDVETIKQPILINLENDGEEYKPEDKSQQDLLIKEFSLRMNTTTSTSHMRYYYKSNYILTAPPKYYNKLNLRFNELMLKAPNHEFNENIKSELRKYLIDLQKG